MQRSGLDGKQHILSTRFERFSGVSFGVLADLMLGVQCFRDPIENSCLLFGSSGSSIIRPLKNNTNTNTTGTQYAWVGPLSLYKGCDGARIIDSKSVNYGGQNPGVFTSSACYLSWIAEQYGLDLDPSLVSNSRSCAASSGDRMDANVTRCFTNRNTKDKMSFCVFDKSSIFEFEILKDKPIRIILDKCKLFGVEG